MNQLRGCTAWIATMCVGLMMMLGPARLSADEVEPDHRDPMICSESDLIAQYQVGLANAKSIRQHVLVVFLDPEESRSKSWLQFRKTDREAIRSFADYQTLFVDAHTTSANELAAHLAVELDPMQLPTALIVRPDEKRLFQGPLPREANKASLDLPALRSLLAAHALVPLDAHKLVNIALSNAHRSNRRVIVQATGVWCPPCHQLSNYLEKHREIWQKDYLWVKVDGRWTGSQEVIRHLAQGHSANGIPWMAIIDSDVNVLATSSGPNGNIGFPSTEPNIEHFLSMLRETKIRLTEEDLQTLKAGLEKE